MTRALSLSLAGLVLAGTAQAQRPGPPAGRPGIEREVRQRFAQVVQRELQLNETQMRQLQATLQRTEGARMELVRRENEARRNLREELREGEHARQERVSGLLDELLLAQKRRLELHEQEDRELRGFLTPVQRAKYFGLQEQLRRRVEEMQRERGRGGGRRGPPPGQP